MHLYASIQTRVRPHNPPTAGIPPPSLVPSAPTAGAPSASRRRRGLLTRLVTTASGFGRYSKTPSDDRSTLPAEIRLTATASDETAVHGMQTTDLR